MYHLEGHNNDVALNLTSLEWLLWAYVSLFVQVVGVC